MYHKKIHALEICSVSICFVKGMIEILMTNAHIFHTLRFSKDF